MWLLNLSPRFRFLHHGRARVKPGLRILQVQPTAKKAWSITVDTNSKHTSATVTVTRVDEETALPERYIAVLPKCTGHIPVGS